MHRFGRQTAPGSSIFVFITSINQYCGIIYEKFFITPALSGIGNQAPPRTHPIEEKLITIVDIAARDLTVIESSREKPITNKMKSI